MSAGAKCLSVVLPILAWFAAAACSDPPHVLRTAEPSELESDSGVGEGGASNDDAGPVIVIPDGGEAGAGIEDPCEGENPPPECDPTPTTGPACGDGVVNQDAEVCDDGNGLPGDGCDGRCQVEPYYECDPAGGPCSSTIACGNLNLDPEEVCDDGNTVDGDGCSADCRSIELCFTCPQRPEAGECWSTVVCGDSVVTKDITDQGEIVDCEICDDGNEEDGDGCSADCLAVEPGYACNPPGQPCERLPACGDGEQTPGEACDDSNTVGGDGCSADCQEVEQDYLCPTPGEPCVYTVECGDGIVNGGEQCDDGNLVPGDGCSDTCTTDPGWTCLAPGVPCLAAECGDGIRAGIEQCEPDTTNPPAACQSDCTLDPAYACEPNGAELDCAAYDSACNNDGTVDLGERCDDGNNDTGDGCTPFCELEPDCSGIKSTDGCSSTCGDGMILASDVNEECDDGNVVDGDGCSSTCTVEPGWACTVSGGPAPTSIDVPVTFRDMIALPLGGAVRHPDFEEYSGSAETPGMVENEIGDDGKPVYTGICEAGNMIGPCPYNEQSTSQADFDQWYRDTDGVNVSIATELSFDQIAANTYQYSTTSLFPFDDLGWTASGDEDTHDGHNFGFTSEARYWFEYGGGEALDFYGDDDLWVFINGYLAVDVGGLHPQTAGSVTLGPTEEAAFQLVVGNIYEISLFHAERHTAASNFQLTLGGFVKSTSECNPDCGDGIVTGGEQCDDGVNDGGYGECQPGCLLGPFCGDGTVTDPPELCDDGINQGTYNSGQCAPGCIPAPYCGDGQADGTFGEECDDGVNDGSYGGCTSDCQIGPHCGDGIVNGNEECDDGVNDGTTCAPDCTLAGFCGDGIVQELLGEQCDDGVNDGGYGECAPGCVLGPYCGDGVVTPPETCDDGVNDGSYGGCTSTCEIGPHCGDGVVNGNERCDDGVNDGGYGECAPGCVLGPYCGDGVVNGDEDCDGGTGCNDFCLFEVVE